MSVLSRALKQLTRFGQYVVNITVCPRYLGPFNAAEVDTDPPLNWNTNVRFEWVKADGATEQRAEVNVTCKMAQQRGVPKPEAWKSKSANDVASFAQTAELVADGHLPISAKADGARVSCKRLP